MTRSGVEYNLEVSPYIYQVEDLEFRFSSNYNMNKFKEQSLLNEYYEYLEKFFNRHNIPVIPFKLSLIFLYTKIEKRGFYIKKNGIRITCLNL